MARDLHVSDPNRAGHDFLDGFLTGFLKAMAADARTLVLGWSAQRLVL